MLVTKTLESVGMAVGPAAIVPPGRNLCRAWWSPATGRGAWTSRYRCHFASDRLA